MVEYEVMNMPDQIKWTRIDGMFYVNKKYLDEFLVKFDRYKKGVA